MLPSGRGYDTSFHYQEGAMDHWSSCNCVDGMCSAPNNGYSNGPNNTAPGQHCWQGIAKPDAPPVRDCRAEPGCTDGPHGDGPATLLDMQGQGDTDLWCTNVPCYGRNNTGEYNDLLFTQEAIRLIEANDPSVPFFMSAQHPSWPICPLHSICLGPNLSDRETYSREQVLRASGEPLAAGGADGVHGQVPEGAVLESAHHERNVKL